MKSKNEIFRWLKANLGKRCLAPLTSTDAYALVTSVNLCNLISWSGAPRELFEAYHAIVSQMQPQCRYLAYHAIAFELDWSHRGMIWSQAELSFGDVRGVCHFEHPGGEA